MQKWIIAGVTLAILIALLVGFGANRGAAPESSALTRQPVSAPPRIAVRDEEPIVVKPSVWVPPVEDYNRPQVKSEAEEKAEALAVLQGLRTASGNNAPQAPSGRRGGTGPMSLLMNGDGSRTETRRDKYGTFTITRGAPMEGWQREQIDRDRARQQLRDLGVEVKDTPDEKFMNDLYRRGLPRP